MVTAHIPAEVKDFIFKPSNENMIISMDYDKNPIKPMDLDALLDKIKQFGIESLTEDEKFFLDNFDNWVIFRILVFTLQLNSHMKKPFLSNTDEIKEYIKDLKRIKVIMNN